MLLLAAACSSAPPAPTTDEGRLRARLGVPPDARRVMIFAQTAHLDIDWQRTFDDYYQSFVGDIFLEARHILDTQPRAHYSIAEMAYLKHHLQVHPEELAPLQKAVARGALRIVGGGMTSPDTLLPEVELLLRDFLYGARFADTLGARPHAAWLPDSFGHSATVPDWLSAAGYDSVAFARVDGAPTFFEYAFHPEIGIKPGSTAALLQQLGSADFTWRGPGGGTVLAHYVASGLYCTGDNIDYDEILQIPGGHIGVFDGDDPSFTDKQVDGYAAALGPYARTPYLFVPVGCDFQHPKQQLLAYLDGYNRRRYPSTGMWAAAAPFEDYAQLVAAHRDELPELSGELSPYFMGFYGSRADVKRRVRDAARPLYAAETFAVVATDGGRADQAVLAPLMETLARGDHHDFVTGTAKDEVVSGEQLPLCDTVEQGGAAQLASVANALAARIAPAAGSLGRVLVLNPAGTAQSSVVSIPLPAALAGQPLHAVAAGAPLPLEPVDGDATTARLALADLPPWSWTSIDLVAGALPVPPAVTLQLTDDAGQPVAAAAATRVLLSNARVRAEWRRAPAFALTSLTIDGVEAMAAPSFQIVDYADMGGLWRLGNEMAGCTLTPSPSPADPAAGESVEVLAATATGARVAFHSPSLGTVREVELQANDGGLNLALTTGAVSGTTRTAAFALAAGWTMLTAGQPGGAVTHPYERVYSPTFWPAVDWILAGPWAILLRQSTGVRMSLPGSLELMAARNAQSEQCDVEGGMGSDDGVHRIEWRLVPAAATVDAARAAQTFNRPLVALAVGAAAAGPDLPAQESLASVDGDGVLSALKPADTGDGAILRVLLEPGPAQLHLSPRLAARTAIRTDALERDLELLGPAGATLTIDREHWGAIATLRLR